MTDSDCGGGVRGWCQNEYKAVVPLYHGNGGSREDGSPPGSKSKRSARCRRSIRVRFWFTSRTDMTPTRQATFSPHRAASAAPPPRAAAGFAHRSCTTRETRGPRRARCDARNRMASLEPTSHANQDHTPHNSSTAAPSRTHACDRPLVSRSCERAARTRAQAEREWAARAARAALNHASRGSQSQQG